MMAGQRRLRHQDWLNTKRVTGGSHTRPRSNRRHGPQWNRSRCSTGRTSRSAGTPEAGRHRCCSSCAGGPAPRTIRPHPGPSRAARPAVPWSDPPECSPMPQAQRSGDNTARRSWNSWLLPWKITRFCETSRGSIARIPAHPVMPARPANGKGPHRAALSLLHSDARQLTAGVFRDTRSTLGVTNTSSSALSLLRLRFLNRLPRNGTSPRNGTLLTLLRSVNSYTPPITTV